MTAPKRPWFRFGLRTMFVVVTVLACWLGYGLNWIRIRHEVLRRSDISANMDAMDASEGTTVIVNSSGLLDGENASAPGLLWLFGECGYNYLLLRSSSLRAMEEEPTPEVRAEIERLQKVFPESWIGRYYIPPPPLPKGPGSDFDGFKM